MLLELNTRTAIIGDLHGHVIDLFRQLGKIGLPPACNYLFLGDLVDRGEFSTETTIVILLLKALFPENVHCIRGNHEFAEMSNQGGFGAELQNIYGSEKAEEKILSCFSYMPIAALIGPEVLCVHGGICPSLYNLKQLSEIPRPLTTYTDELVQGLLWSDPAEFLQGFQPSSRGVGFFFGPDALAQFLDSHHLKLLVRGHECVDGGIESQLERRMVTVFGASNYCGLKPNKAAVMIVHPDDGRREVAIFQPLKYYKRAQAKFVTSESETVFKLKRGAAMPSKPPSGLTVHKGPAVAAKPESTAKVVGRPPAVAKGPHDLRGPESPGLKAAGKGKVSPVLPRTGPFK
jgi:protein phosphatase